MAIKKTILDMKYYEQQQPSTCKESTPKKGTTCLGTVTCLKDPVPVDKQKKPYRTIFWVLLQNCRFCVGESESIKIFERNGFFRAFRLRFIGGYQKVHFFKKSYFFNFFFNFYAVFLLVFGRFNTVKRFSERFKQIRCFYKIIEYFFANFQKRKISKNLP